MLLVREFCLKHRTASCARHAPKELAHWARRQACLDMPRARVGEASLGASVRATANDSVLASPVRA